MTMVWPQRFRTIPTPMAGLALGVASVAWCADTVLGAGGWLQATGAAAAAALLLLLAVRSIFHFDTVMADWRHPVAGSIIPTFAMGGMVISKTVGIVSPAAGMGLWLGCTLRFWRAFCFFGFGVPSCGRWFRVGSCRPWESSWRT